LTENRPNTAPLVEQRLDETAEEGKAISRLDPLTERLKTAVGSIPASAKR